jgi:hypothetical protein
LQTVLIKDQKVVTREMFFESRVCFRHERSFFFSIVVAVATPDVRLADHITGAADFPLFNY